MPIGKAAQGLPGEGVFSLNRDGSLNVRSKFHYEKLPSDQHFRLLELFPRKRKLPFEIKFHVPSYPYLLATLSTHALTETSSYECLSYTWGTSHNRRAIWLDNSLITISETLDMALRSLRHETESRFLWVDFVCINQEDLKEKEQQVQHMFKIFSKAKSVIAYVGEEVDGSEHVPEILARMQNSSTDTKPNARIDIWCETDLAALGLPLYSDQKWTALQKFVSRPWFSRVWIIQECLAAKSLYILCGSWMFLAGPFISGLLLADIRGGSCFGFHAAQETLFDRPITRGFLQVKFMAHLGLCSIFDTFETDDAKYSLIDVLEGARHARSTDSRDKVFALLNLCRDPTALGIRPDYNLEAAEVFRQVAHALVKNGQGGRLLLSAGIPGSTLGLPSWVTDWSLENIPFNKIVGSSYTFLESDSRSQEAKTPGIRIESFADQLIVSTRVIDSVAVLHPLCNDNHVKEPCTVITLNEIREELFRGSISNKIPNSESLKSNKNIVELKTQDDPYREGQTERDNSEKADRNTEWPPFSRVVYLSIVWIGASPRYDNQDLHEIALRTLICDHAYGAGGESFCRNILQDFKSYLKFTRFVHDPEYRPKHAQTAMARISGSSPNLDDPSKEAMRSAYADYLLSQRDATTRILLKLGRFYYEMRLACTRDG